MKGYNMIIQYTEKEDLEKELDDIWEILCQCDHEFIPSLSSRNSSAQTNFSFDLATNQNDKPYLYFEELKKQHFILAKIKDQVIGFMTFKTNYNCEALEEFGTSNYITTVCVRKEYRRQGALKQLYDCMENDLPKSLSCNRISTRTWSQNSSHISLLYKRGYALLRTLKNDRGVGIDTLYFGKLISYSFSKSSGDIYSQ